MEQNKTKSTKKKKLLFWLTLAAIILIIAAITFGVIFAVRSGSQDLTIDNNPNQGEEQNPPDDGGDDDDSKNVDTQTQFISPISDVDLIKVMEFCHDETMDWYRLHDAMDFRADAGTEVLAAVDGTVTKVVTSDLLDYAVVEIEHANNLRTVYRFIDPDSNLKKGQSVSRGQVIGTVAPASGRENKEGAHLHFEVYANDKIADPDDYLHISAK